MLGLDDQQINSRKRNKKMFKKELIKVENDLVDIELSRQQLLQRLKGGAEFNRQKRNVQIKSQKDLDDRDLEETIELIERMNEACVNDHEAIKHRKQAMHRFNLINTVGHLLKKKHVQEIFLQTNGCRILEFWLHPNPDDSLPPIQVVECILGILNELPITKDHIESCQITREVARFASGASNGDLPTHLVSAATKLLQKWQTVVYQLSYEYDQQGLHEIKQRDLRRRLEVIRDLEQGKPAAEDEDLIKKTPNGFVFMKQNFDFLEKPASHIDAETARVNSVKQAINKVFVNHKAQSLRNSRK